MPPNQLFRILAAIALVGLWMGLGWLLRLDPNSYLLMGVPLLLLFQVFVARRPVTELWLKNGRSFQLPWWGFLMAAGFMAYPGVLFVEGWKLSPLPIKLWEMAAMLGAIPLAWTLVNANLGTWKSLLGCFLTAGILGSSLMILTSLAIHHGFHPRRDAWRIGVTNFLLYLPVCFVLEEVFFRGGLDSYIQKKGDRFGWLTAVLLSCLWGWWHIPILPVKGWIQMVGVIISVPLITCPTGIPFSIFWRRSGSLLVPATIHAFIDSVRNAVM